MAFNVGSIGYNYSHDNHFVMDKPMGPGSYLFLLVKSSAYFKISGKAYYVNKDSYVLFNPTTPHMYKAQKDLYIDDWMFFWMSEEDKEELLKIGIKFDEPVYLKSTEELSQIIHGIAFEHYSEDPFHLELKELKTKELFFTLARILASRNFTAPDRLSSKNDKLTYLRTILFDYPNSFGNIDEMADFMNMSRSGFQHLYKKVFGHSVINDVINGKISKAKALLETSVLTISEIAEKCGYKTEYHFMRQFKLETGLTPTEYRKSCSWNTKDEKQI